MRNILIIGAGKSTPYIVKYLTHKSSKENLFLTICVEGGFFAMVFMGTYLFYAFKWVTNEGVKLMLIALTVYSFFNYEIYSIFYLMILLLPMKEVNNFNDT